MKRTSIDKLDIRKLLADVKQQKGYRELTLELLFKIQGIAFFIPWKVSIDGIPPL